MLPNNPEKEAVGENLGQNRTSSTHACTRVIQTSSGVVMLQGLIAYYPAVNAFMTSYSNGDQHQIDLQSLNKGLNGTQTFAPALYLSIEHLLVVVLWKRGRKEDSLFFIFLMLLFSQSVFKVS